MFVGWKRMDLRPARQFPDVSVLLFERFEDMMKWSGVSYMWRVSQCKKMVL